MFYKFTWKYPGEVSLNTAFIFDVWNIPYGEVQPGIKEQAGKQTVLSVYHKLTGDRISFCCCLRISNSYLNINQIVSEAEKNIIHK